VFKRSVAQIVIENVAVHAGDKDIRKAVVIVVRDGHGGGVSVPGHPGARGYVRKRAVAVVAVQAVVKLRPGFVQGGRRGAVGEKDVHAAVVVEIQRGNASGHQFDLVGVPGGAVGQMKRNAGARGNILETNLRGQEAG